MSSTSDPLTALRQAIKSKDPITYSKDDEAWPSLAAATHILISPGYSFPKSTPTRYRKTDAKSDQDVYSLEAVYLAWLLRSAPGAEYMKQARENGLPIGSVVSVTERSKVVEWLEGKTQDNERIVPLVGESNNSTPSLCLTRRLQWTQILLLGRLQDQVHKPYRQQLPTAGRHSLTYPRRPPSGGMSRTPTMSTLSKRSSRLRLSCGTGILSCEASNPTSVPLKNFRSI